MAQLINEARRIQFLAGLINESQLEEALNKDIRAFGKDIDNRLKEAGFNTLILMDKDISQEQLKKIRSELGFIAFEVKRNTGSEGEIQQIYLYCNPKEFQKVKKVIDKFQLANYNGQAKFNNKTWTTKTIMGAINPGDIVKIEDPISGQIWFYRYEKVKRQVKTSGGGVDRQYGGGGASYDITTTNTAQKSISEIESVVNEEEIKSVDQIIDTPKAQKLGDKLSNDPSLLQKAVKELEKIGIDKSTLEKAAVAYKSGQDVGNIIDNKVKAAAEKISEALSPDEKKDMGKNAALGGGIFGTVGAMMPIFTLGAVPGIGIAILASAAILGLIGAGIGALSTPTSNESLDIDSIVNEALRKVRKK